MMNKKLSVAFLGIFITFSSVIYGQFTYFETGVGLNVLPLESDFSETQTGYTNMSVRLAATFRIKRHFGIGIEGSIPVIQNSKFSFKSGTFFKFDSYYTPRKFDYSFKESPRVSVFARFFMDTYVNAYIDVRLSVFSFTESFVFYRDSIPPLGNKSAIPKYDINDEIKYLQIIPGFSIGIKPRIGKRFFANLNLGANIYIFNEASFKYRIPYQWNFSYYDYDRVELNSQVGKVKGAFHMNVGFGYFF